MSRRWGAAACWRFAPPRAWSRAASPGKIYFGVRLVKRRAAPLLLAGLLAVASARGAIPASKLASRRAAASCRTPNPEHVKTRGGSYPRLASQPASRLAGPGAYIVTADASYSSRRWALPTAYRPLGDKVTPAYGEQKVADLRSGGLRCHVETDLMSLDRRKWIG